MGPSGGLTKDNIGVENACLIFAIAESRLEEGCIWAGTNDGLLHVTRDGGKSWTNVTANIPDLPVWGTFSNIEPSRYHPGTAYVTVDYHQMNNRDPYVFKTTDYGNSWKSISSNIPHSVFSYCHWVHEDPKREGLLYLGTENAIYVSFNDGARWMPLQNNLPHAPVHHMVIQEHFNDLVVGTYGRGFWIMDDITPLQQLTDDVLASEAHLFEPRDAYRFQRVTGGPTASASANINYYLKSESKGGVELRILDSSGETVNTLNGSSRKGINRVSWNLKYPGAEQARLRVPPEGNPRVVEEKRFKERYIRDGWFPILSWGTRGGYSGITVAPGEYTIVMTVGGKEHRQQLKVRKDPRSAGTLSDIRHTVAMQVEVREDILAVTELVNRMEWMRRQLIDLQAALSANGGSAEVAVAANELENKVQAVEDRVVQPYSKEGDSKSFRFANLLYAKLSVLGGDLARNADFAPNVQQGQVHAKLKKQLNAYSAQFTEIVERDLPAFNKMLEEHGIGGVIMDRAH